MDGTYARHRTNDVLRNSRLLRDQCPFSLLILLTRLTNEIFSRSPAHYQSKQRTKYGEVGSMDSESDLDLDLDLGLMIISYIVFEPEGDEKRRGKRGRYGRTQQTT